jgi:hypothetical protein
MCYSKCKYENYMGECTQHIALPYDAQCVQNEMIIDLLEVLRQLGL